MLNNNKTKKKEIPENQNVFGNSFVNKTWTQFATKPKCTVRKLFIIYCTWWDVSCCRYTATFDYLILFQALLGIQCYIGYVNHISFLTSKIFWIFKKNILNFETYLAPGILEDGLWICTTIQLSWQKSRGHFFTLFS